MGSYDLEADRLRQVKRLLRLRNLDADPAEINP